MLQIKEIRKKYVTGDLIQTALDGVSLTLRDNEFVAILGPSGSGKTTLLNVIGGLDRYDSGDLVINGISTRKYTDRDWDSYRNHTIGFVFQSYNLIPHQTVLANVELALTISGISRAERRKRAAQALESVGLGDQLHKRPNQMSGGQMQRVAIARALVNNPDILLADEPTGALDSETSVQIMDLLKEVAKDRLVVMVTHNPELAYEYANRIVRVKDGRIVDDSNPFELVLPEQMTPKHKNMGHSSMSFLTALALSFNNLKTKLARTLLTAFAGSIGIIGIALILSLSTGFQLYIDKIQEDTLSNYPLTIQTETADMTSMMAAMGSAMSQAQDAQDGVVVEQPMISQMFAQIGANDLGSFKTYLDENYDQVSHAINDIKYSYGVKPLLFAADTSDGILQVNPGTLFGQLTGSSAMSAYMDTDVFQEMAGNLDMLNSQYDVLRGRWPENYLELVVVLPDPHQITDYIAYTVGLKDPEELTDMITQVMQGIEPEKSSEVLEWTYDELMALEFKLVPATGRYRYNSAYQVWEDMSGDSAYMEELIRRGETLKVVGIVCPKDGVSATTLPAGIAYTADLTRHVIETAAKAPIVTSQRNRPNVDVFTGREFGAEDEGSQLSFEDLISIDEEAISSSFGMNIDASTVMAVVENYIAGIYDSVMQDTVPAQTAFSDTLASLARDMLQSYVAANADENGRAPITLEGASGMVDAYLSGGSAQALIQPMASEYQLSVDTFARVYRPLLIGMISSHVADKLADQMTEGGSIADRSAWSGEVLQTPPEGEDTQPPPEGTQPPTEETQAPTEGTEPPTEGTEPPTEEDEELPDETQPPEQGGTDIDIRATISADEIDALVSGYMSSTVVTGTSAVMAGSMTEAAVRQKVLSRLDGLDDVLMSYIGGAFYVDEEKLASAFQFEMDEEELMRLMEAMSPNRQEATAQTNLQSLGYADLAQPTSLAVYMTDFAGKEDFLAFLDGYNAKMEAEGREEQVISYTDITGIMMSSVRTIIDSVSYVLIAFVAVSLIVSSIMNGIITYISVMERTKEIGVLRAIGASKRNISQVFNAETFIIGLCSGLIGVGVTLLANIPINRIIHHFTGNLDINAQLPMISAGILVLLSMGLTLLGGLIPAKQAAKKDPVIALRSE